MIKHVSRDVSRQSTGHVFCGDGRLSTLPSGLFGFVYVWKRQQTWRPAWAARPIRDPAQSLLYWQESLGQAVLSLLRHDSVLAYSCLLSSEDVF